MNNKINLIKPALGLALIMLLSVPLLLLINAIIARNLSAVDFGYYSFVLSFSAILSIPVASGMPLLLTREIARYTQLNEWGKYRAIIRCSMAWAIILSIFLAILWIFLKSIMSQITLGVLDLDTLFWSVSIVPFLGLIAIQSGIIRGLGYPVIASLPSQIAHPFIFITGIIIFSSLGQLNVINTIILYIFTLGIVALLSIIFLWWIQRKDLNDFLPDYSLHKEWFRSIISFGAMSAMIVVSVNLAILLLGLTGQKEAAAYMRVAERGAQLVLFPILMIEGIIAPKLVQSIEINQRGVLKELSRNSARLGALGAAGMAVILILYGKQLIKVTFGPEYSEPVYIPMIILVIAQFIYVLTGSPSLLLAMAKFEKQSVIGNFLGILVILLAASLLLTKYGAIGAAVSVAIAIILSKAYLLVMAKKKVGFWAGVL